MYFKQYGEKRNWKDLVAILDDHEDFLRRAYKHDTPAGKRYWIFSIVIVAIVLLLITALWVFRSFLLGYP